MTAYKFIKLNEDWIPVEYVEDEHDSEKDFQPSFWWWGKRYFLDDFIRLHNNPWVSDTDVPDYIHAFYDSYTENLYIELDEAGENINVYKEVEA